MIKPSSQGCTIYAVKGSVEIAGVALKNNIAYPFDEPALCYTSVGGQVCVVGEGLEITQTPVELDAILKLVRRLIQVGQEFRIAVLGAPGSGKTLASSVLANGLSRGLAAGVSLCDLSPRNHLVTAGFVSSCTVTPQAAMWRGSPWTERHSVSAHFCGCSGLTDSVVSSYVGTASVAVDGALWRTSGGGCVGSVFDFPNCDDASPTTVVLPLLDFIRPTHVVVLGEWADVTDAIRRRFPGVALMKSEALVSAQNSIMTAESRLQQYFRGTVASPKLVNKVSCKLSDLTFLAVQNTSTFLECRPIKFDEVPVPSILSVSLADAEKEVPFANSAGVVWLVDIDESRNEASLYVPNGSHELPSNFLVIPLPGQLEFNTLL